MRENEMLKKIPAIISPELMHIMMAMGHGDELVIADGNFPSESMGQRVVRADGHGVAELLDAIMTFFPLDQFVENPVCLMQVVAGDATKPVIWKEYRRIIAAHEPDFKDFEMVERFAFYERARKAFAVAASGEPALYANLILKKGVVR
jgi:L-fucose mutarotase